MHDARVYACFSFSISIKPKTHNHNRYHYTALFIEFHFIQSSKFDANRFGDTIVNDNNWWLYKGDEEIKFSPFT